MFSGPRARRRLPLTLLFLLLAASQLAPSTAVVGHARAATLSASASSTPTSTPTSTTSTSSGNNGTIKIAESPAIDEPPAGGSNEPHVTCPFWIQGYKFPVRNGTLSVSVQAPAVSPQTVGQVIINSLPYTGTQQTGGYFFNLPDNTTGFGWADGFVSGGHYEVDITDARNDKNKVFFTVTCAAPPNTPTNTPTATATDTPTDTPTSTPTDTATNTPTNTATDTPANTPTPEIRYVTLPAPSPITVVQDVPAPTASPATTYTPLPTYTPAPTSTPFSQVAAAKVVTKIRYREITRTTTRVKVRQVVKTVLRYRTVTQVKHVTRVRTVVHHKLVYQTRVRYVTVVRYQTRVVTQHRTVTRVVTQYHYIQYPKTGRFAAPIAVRASGVIPAAESRMSIARLGISWAAVWSRGYIPNQDGTFQYEIVPSYGLTRFNGSAAFGQKGLTLVYGHDDVYGSIFHYLGNMRRGDVIQVWQGHHQYQYRVTMVQIVNPAAVQVLNRSWTRPTLALVSCYPFWNDTDRVVVIAQMR